MSRLFSIIPALSILKPSHTATCSKKTGLNLTETKPIKSFWQCWKEYGPPLPRIANYKKGDYKLGKPSLGKPKCCVYLKELPFKNFTESSGVKATLTGLRAAESRARMFTFSQFGQNYTTHKFGYLTKFNPLAFWTSKQVWQYLKDNNLPINQVYLKGAERTGCMPCTSFKTWAPQLAKTNPRMYRYVQKLLGQNLIDNYLELENQTVESCSQRQIQAVLQEWF
jgi:3'-phosphoadenosine 5'-phosphosulfate sulfotransferase (PAPS reductase)/FAD synthetase